MSDGFSMTPQVNRLTTSGLACSGYCYLHGFTVHAVEKDQVFAIFDSLTQDSEFVIFEFGVGKLERCVEMFPLPIIFRRGIYVFMSSLIHHAMIFCTPTIPE